MISYSEANLNELSVHHVGNKLQDEYLSLSETTINLDDEVLKGLLLKFFLQPFEKVSEVYRFHNSNQRLDLNDAYNFASEHFKDSASFHEVSKHFARHLFEVSTHPKIKAGELYVASFSNVQVDGEKINAIGVFKSENKETYLRVNPKNAGFEVTYEQDAININKLDKGCLIIDNGLQEGYTVIVVDGTNKSQEALYWKDNFLNVQIQNNDYNQTNTILGVYKNFVTTKIGDDFEIGKTDKIDLLNRSMKYFKDNQVFDLNEFTNEVIGNEQGIASFLNYKKDFEEEFEIPISDNFDIHDAAVKKQARAYKSVLKLDKNFHIYIHGDKQLIERGFDKDKSMNYYKVYFQQEE